MRRQNLLPGMVLAMCLVPWTVLLAQEDVPPAPPVPSVAAPEEASSTSSPAPPSPRERIIYVPFEVLEGTFEKPDANVVLPYAEYLRLRQEWEKSQQPKPAPAAVISRAEYVATVDGDLARIIGTLTVNVLGDSWSEVPLNFGDAAVASISGEQVLLRGVGDGVYSLLLGKTGEQTVTIELAARVLQSPSGRELQFKIPQVGVSTLELIVPESDQTIEVLPRLLTQPTENPAPGTTRIKASLGSTPQVTARWHPRTSLKPEMELLTTVTNDSLVTIEDGLVHTDAYLTYDVLRGRLDLVTIAVPVDQRILDVSASVRVKSWKADMRDGQQVITVELLGENDKQVVVEVHTERKLPSEGFSVAGLPETGGAAGIHALDAVRESGQIAIRHADDLSVAVSRQSGVVRIEQGELHERLQGKNAFAFKYFSPRLVLDVAAKTVEPRITVTHSASLTFEEDELTLDASLAFNVERAGIFEVVIKLPENLTVDQVSSPQLKEYAIDDPNRTLTVTLDQRTIGAFNIQIRGHRAFDASTDTSEQTLPLIEPTGVERETGTLFVFARDAIEVITNQEGLVSAQPLQTGPGMRRGEAALTSAWTFTRRPVVVPVRTVRKPTRLSASVATLVDLQPETTTVNTSLSYLIEYAGIDTFRFQVPESVSDRVQIEAVNVGAGNAAIKQKTASDPADGWVTWTVVMQREVVGTQTFKVTYDLTTQEAGNQDADDAAQAAEPAITVQAVRAQGTVNAQGEEQTPLVKIYGEVIVNKERSLTISADADSTLAEAIDVREITLVPADPGQVPALAYRYFRQPDTGSVQISLTRTRNEVQEVVGTVVSRALVEIVTAEDAQATFRARYHIKTAERQRLLVSLPSKLEVLGVFVDEREVKLEKAEGENPKDDNWSAYWVNVARTGDSDTPFLLTFQFLWNVNPPLGESDYGRGNMDLPLPVIGSDPSAVAVQQLRVVIWIPKDYALVGEPEGFTLKQMLHPFSFLFGSKASPLAENLDQWLTNGEGYPTAYLNFPTDDRVPYTYDNLGGRTRIRVVWWNKVYNSIWLSIGVAVVGFILMKTSWENKLGMLLLAAFAAVLFGLQDSHALAHGLSAARYGLATLIGLWLLHEIARWGRGLAKPAVVAASSSPVPAAEATAKSSAPTTIQPSAPSSTEVKPAQDSDGTRES